MPNRVLRDSILTSERVNALSPAAELLYRRLISVVDDWGRTEAHTTIVRTRAYPLDPDRYSNKEIDAQIAECANQGLVVLYVVGKTRYLQITNFKQRTRAKVSKYPGPGELPAASNDPIPWHRFGGHDDGHDDGHCGSNPPSDGTPFARRARTETETETETLDEGESAIQLGKMTSRLRDEFQAFIDKYPRQVKLDEAFRSWTRLVERGEITEVNVAEVHAGLARYIDSAAWAEDGGKYIPDTVSFLTGNIKHNGRLWKDKPKPSAEAIARDKHETEYVAPWEKKPPKREDAA